MCRNYAPSGRDREQLASTRAMLAKVKAARKDAPLSCDFCDAPATTRNADKTDVHPFGTLYCGWYRCEKADHPK